MNRQIKFRGFNLKNKQWIYGYYLVNRGKHYIVKDEVVEPFVEESDFEVDPESVGQFVCNADGVDIYEGDIVDMVCEEPTLSRRGTIGWNSLYCEWKIYGECRFGDALFMEKSLFKYEVIGNEYEKKLSNP